MSRTLATLPWRMSSAQVGHSVFLLHIVAPWSFYFSSCVRWPQCRPTGVWSWNNGQSKLKPPYFTSCSPLSFSQCPLSWQNKWEGPEEPMQYLRAVVTRALAIQVNHRTTSWTLRLSSASQTKPSETYGVSGHLETVHINLTEKGKSVSLSMFLWQHGELLTPPL